MFNERVQRKQLKMLYKEYRIIRKHWDSAIHMGHQNKVDKLYTHMTDYRTEIIMLELLLKNREEMINDD